MSTDAEALRQGDLEVHATAVVGRSFVGHVSAAFRARRLTERLPALAIAERVEVDRLLFEILVDDAIGEAADDPLRLARGNEEIATAVARRAGLHDEPRLDAVPTGRGKR
jgi:hypothetical protein